MPRETGIPLQEILKHPGLRVAKVVAGGRGLDRIVTSVNIMEVPDILDWVKEGELLLTTVYAIRHDLSAQSKLISELAAKKLAGLAIKPGRYIEKIPEVMIEQANYYDLPLLELPLATSFSDLIQPIMSEILNRHILVLQRADEVHSRLSQIVLEGGAISDIASALASLLGDNLVVIENAGGSLRVTAPEAIENFPIEQAVRQVALLAKGKRGTLRGTVSWGRQVRFFHAPIWAGKKHYGAITVFETKSEVSTRDEITVERAATVAGLEMANQLAVTAVERRYYNEFINEILVAGVAEEKSLRQRGLNLGIDLKRIHSVAVMHLAEKNGGIEPLPAAPPEFAENKNAMLQQILLALREKFPDVPIGYKYEGLVLFVPQPEGQHTGRRDGCRGRIKEIVACAENAVHELMPEMRVLTGVSRPASGLAGLQGSYQEALRTCQLGPVIWPANSVYYFEELGVYRLLGSIADRQELRSFVNETIGSIVAYDKAKGAELIKTLEVFFECRGNLKKVSERLYTHYNTILYRMERISKIAQFDLDDATACLNVQLGLKMLKLLEIQRQTK